MVPETYLEDASGYRGEAERLFRPATAEEVAEILRAASAAATPVTVAGAGTGVTGGRCAQGGWVVSLERFQTLEIRPGSALAGAGVRLNDLQAAAAKTGQFYAPDPTEWTASVGGTIATNASGSRSFLYGPTRRHIAALTAVFMDGSIRLLRREDPVEFELPALPLARSTKNSAGYLLRPGMTWVDLLCGSEGTLAVVVDAVLDLMPNPVSLLTGVVFFATEAAQWDAVEAWRNVAGLRMLESFDGPSLSFLRERYPEIPAEAGAALLIEQIAGPDSVDEWVDRLDVAQALAEESWFGDSPTDRERFRKLRHALPELVNDRVRRNGFQKMGTDFAVPLEANAAMLAFYRRRLNEEFPGRSVTFGHIGDAHVHVNLLPETAEEEARGRELIKEFAREAVRLHGTVSAEHGLGKKKSHLLALQYSPQEIEQMKAVKRRLDPQWLLGRGTLFGEP